MWSKFLEASFTVLMIRITTRITFIAKFYMMVVIITIMITHTTMWSHKALIYTALSPALISAEAGRVCSVGSNRGVYNELCYTKRLYVFRSDVCPRESRRLSHSCTPRQWREWTIWSNWVIWRRRAYWGTCWSDTNRTAST